MEGMGFAFFIIGGIAICYFLGAKRMKQIAYECELIFKWNGESLGGCIPSVGDVVYLFDLNTLQRRSPLGTNVSAPGAGGNTGAFVYVMSDKLYAKRILGVISALDGTNMHIETFGFEGKGVWHVVDSKGQAIGIGRVGSAINLTVSDNNQSQFTEAEIGSSNAVLLSFKKLV